MALRKKGIEAYLIDREGTPMTFLLKTAFWLALIIMLLPSDEQQQRQIYGTAEAAVRDVSGFCQRNPDVCDRSSDIFSVFVQKAEFGANMLFGFISDQTAGTVTASGTDRVGSDQPAVAPAHWADSVEGSQGTLTPRDLEPGWAGTNGEGI
jgi:hypothetical protein